MLKIIKENKEWEFDFNGIKLFQNQNPTKLYKDLFLNSEIIIDDKIIKNDEIVYISELTKLSEFIDLSKKSILMNYILNEINENNIIENKSVKSIVQNINSKINYPILSETDGDIIKIISYLFEVENYQYIDENIFKFLINHFFENKKLIIFDNCSWLTLEILYSYINKLNFILLTNNFKKFINKIKQFEILVLDNFVEILDIESLCGYLEKNINRNITDIELLNYAKNIGNDYLNFQIQKLIEKI